MINHLVKTISLKVRYLFSFVYLFVSMFGLMACSETVEYELKDSGMNAEGSSINWLDDERLIFMHSKNNIGMMSIWNTLTGGIELYAHEALGGVCFSDNYITYGIKNVDRTTYLKSGLIGSEKLIVFDWDDEEKAKYENNKYSCKRFIRPVEHNQEYIHYLKKEHGYLHIGPSIGKGFDYPVYVKNDGEKIQMPFLRTYYRKPIGYFPFNKAYFLWAVTGPDERWKQKCRNAWWLYPDGQTESICVPLLEGINGGSVLFYPVVNGYLFISHETGRGKDPGSSGIYFLDKNLNLKNKLVSGIANGISISPDGCKVAFALNPEVKKSVSLKMINICDPIQGEKLWH